MATISDFIKIPKVDSCKHLSSGMRYKGFIHWTEFMIPEFREGKIWPAGSNEDLELREEIASYTSMRIGSSRDAFLLFCHSISESASENVKLLNGTVNVDLLSNLNNPADFIEAIKKACQKYSDQITVKPYLGLKCSYEKNIGIATMLLESGIFSGIELYGTDFAENTENFLTIFKTARKMNLESRICCLGFKDFADRSSVFEIIQNLKPNVLLNPNIVVCMDNLAIFKDGKLFPEVAAFFKDNDIRVEFSPAPFLSGVHAGEKIHAIREFAEKEIKFALCTEDLLFLNKSLSEFAADLCNEGVFSMEELVKILS